MFKIFWFDVETTGLNPEKNAILQLAYQVTINEEVKETGEFRMQPFPGDQIDTQALEINKITMDQLKGFDNPQKVFHDIQNVLLRYVDKYNKDDKFILAGYNVGFDVGFLKAFWKKNQDKYFGSFFTYKPLDVYALVLAYCYFRKLTLPNHKLETMANFFNIPIEAHDARSDIEATRKIFYKIGEQLCPQS